MKDVEYLKDVLVELAHSKAIAVELGNVRDSYDVSMCAMRLNSRLDKIHCLLSGMLHNNKEVPDDNS